MSKLREQIDERLWNSFERFWGDFAGPVPTDLWAPIEIWHPTRAKPAQVEVCTTTAEVMLFDSLPGIPADNRWKTIEPF